MKEDRMIFLIEKTSLARGIIKFSGGLIMADATKTTGGVKEVIKGFLPTTAKQTIGVVTVSAVAATAGYLAGRFLGKKKAN
jgi:hypothetical protein